MNKPDWENNMVGELVGILINDNDKTTHDSIANLPRQIVHGDDGLYGVQAFATNDTRMIAALKLLGYETIASCNIQGVERFMKL